MHGDQRINVLLNEIFLNEMRVQKLNIKKCGFCSLKEMDALSPKNFTWTCLGFKAHTPPQF